jgi:WD40 repeat protein
LKNFTKQTAPMIRHLRKIETGRPVATLAISGDGSLLAVAGGTQVDLFDATGGTVAGRIAAEAAVTGLAISPDKRLIAVAVDHPTVTVFDRDTGRVIHRLVRGTMPDFLREKRQRRVAFLPKTSSLITYGEGDTLAIWNCRSGAWEHLIDIPSPKSSAVVALSPDGTHVAIVCEPDPRAYRGQVTMYRVHHGLQHLWNGRHGTDNAVTSADFSRDGTKLATCGAGNGITIWSVESGKKVAHIDEAPGQPFIGVSFPSDDRVLAVSSRGLELRRLPQRNASGADTIRQAVAIRGFTSAERVVATFGSDATVDVWNVGVSAPGTLKPGR